MSHLELGGNLVEIHTLDTPDKQHHGFQFFKQIPIDICLKFPNCGSHQFHMQNVGAPLLMVSTDDSSVVLGKEIREPETFGKKVDGNGVHVYELHPMHDAHVKIGSALPILDKKEAQRERFVVGYPGGPYLKVPRGSGRPYSVDTEDRATWFKTRQEARESMKLAGWENATVKAYIPKWGQAKGSFDPDFPSYWLTPDCNLVRTFDHGIFARMELKSLGIDVKKIIEETPVEPYYSNSTALYPTMFALHYLRIIATDGNIHYTGSPTTKQISFLNNLAESHGLRVVNDGQRIASGGMYQEIWISPSGELIKCPQGHQSYFPQIFGPEYVEDKGSLKPYIEASKMGWLRVVVTNQNEVLYSVPRDGKRPSPAQLRELRDFAIENGFASPRKAQSEKFTIAVDLDGTILEYDGWKGEDHFGEPKPGAKSKLQKLHDSGCKILIHTTRGNITAVEDVLEKHEIPFDFINENDEQPDGASDKPLADIYLDDRAVRFKNWDQAYRAIEKLRAEGKRTAIRVAAAPSAKIGPLGQCIIEGVGYGGKGTATCWIHKEPFSTKNESWTEKIQEMYPDIEPGDILFSPKVNAPDSTRLGWEKRTLGEAIEEVKRLLRNSNIEPPKEVDSMRATLAYKTRDKQWLRSQPEYNEDTERDADAFLQKLLKIRDLAQGKIDKTMTPEKEAEILAAIREIDENLPIPGVEQVNVKATTPDFADTILDLWEQYKKSPTPELRNQIENMRKKLARKIPLRIAADVLTNDEYYLSRLTNRSAQNAITNDEFYGLGSSDKEEESEDAMTDSSKSYPIPQKEEDWKCSSIPGRYMDWTGQVVYMSPDEFLHLAYPIPEQFLNQESLAKLRDRFKQNLPVDMPILWTTITKSGSIRVIGHEGRHRATVAKEHGIRKLPVAVVCEDLPRTPKRTPEERQLMDNYDKFIPERGTRSGQQLGQAAPTYRFRGQQEERGVNGNEQEEIPQVRDRKLSQYQPTPLRNYTVQSKNNLYSPTDDCDSDVEEGQDDHAGGPTDNTNQARSEYERTQDEAEQ